MIAALFLSASLDTIVAPAGPPELLRSFTPMPMYASRTEYEEQTRWNPPDAPIREWPEGFDESARIGQLYIGLARRVYVVMGTPPAVIADLDGDGSLADEARLPLEARDFDGQPVLVADLGNDGPGRPTRLYFAFIDGSPYFGQAMQQSTTVRRGRIRVGDRTIAFAVEGYHGVYDGPNNRVYFDLDGDGDLALDDPQSAERFLVSDGRVNLDGQGYAFEVDPIGAALKLTPIAGVVPSRATLEAGAPAAAFHFIDADLVPGTLEDYRGRVVLLYFYFAGCVPCQQQLPKIRALHEGLHAQGFEVLAVNTADSVDVIREYVAKLGFPGRHVADGDDGPLGRLYRVQGVPTWFVIDRDGRITGRSGPAGSADLAEEVLALFPDARIELPPTAEKTASEP